MFENGQDIDLIHGSFTSALSLLSNNGSAPHSLVELANTDVNLVLDSISKSLQFVLKCCIKKNENSPSKKKAVLRRINAAIFYKVLRSNNISCPEAENYYEIIDDYLLGMDWNFYMELVERCAFSEYFVECVLQLPDDITNVLLHWTLEVIQSQHVFSAYLLNPVLHILKHKLFGFKYCVNTSEAKFDFDFSSDHEGNSDAVQTPNLQEISSRVLAHLQTLRNHTGLVKVLLDWFVSILHYVNLNVDMDCSSMKPFLDFMQEYFESETTRSFLKNVLNSFKFEEFKRTLELDMHSNAHPGYSLYLLFVNWQEIYRQLCLTSETENMRDIMLQLKCMVEGMYTSHPLQLRNDSMQVVTLDTEQPVLEDYFKMLMLIVDCKMDGLDYTAEMLIWDTSLRKKKEVVTCAQKNLYLYTRSFSNVQLLFSSAMDETGYEKIRLTKLFLEAYQDLPLFTQRALFQVFLQTHGLSTYLRLTSYENDLTHFFNRSVCPEELLTLIFPLCIQSPEETIRKVVKRFVQNGPPMIGLVKALEAVGILCSYRQKNNYATVLVATLLEYFQTDNLKQAEKQNIQLLIEKLLEVFYDDEAFLLDMFLKQCVLPLVSTSESPERLHYSLGILNTCLSYSLSAETGVWFEDFSSIALVVLLCSLINDAIVSLNPSMKEIALCTLHKILKLMEKFPSEKEKSDCNREWLQYQLITMHPVVQFYVWDYVHLPDIELSSMSLSNIICWLIIQPQENPQILSDAILKKYRSLYYIPMVAALVKTVPHFTAEEFAQIPILIGNLKLQSPASNLKKLFNNDDLLICEKIQVLQFVEIMVDVFLLLKNVIDLNLDWNYMLSCLLSVLQDSLSVVEQCPITYTKVFLEICRLGQSFDGYFSTLSRMLEHIINDQKKCKSKLKCGWRKCFAMAVKSFPLHNVSHLLSMLE